MNNKCMNGVTKYKMRMINNRKRVINRIKRVINCMKRVINCMKRKKGKFPKRGSDCLKWVQY